MYEHVILYSTFKLIDNSAEDQKVNVVSNNIFKIEAPFELEERDFESFFEEHIDYHLDRDEHESYEVDEVIIRKVKSEPKKKSSKRNDLG